MWRRSRDHVSPKAPQGASAEGPVNRYDDDNDVNILWEAIELCAGALILGCALVAGFILLVTAAA
jgi:hypothetical protein